MCLSGAAKRQARELCYASSGETGLPRQFKETRSCDVREPRIRIHVVRAEGSGVRYVSLAPRSESATRAMIDAQLLRGLVACALFFRLVAVSIYGNATFRISRNAAISP